MLDRQELIDFFKALASEKRQEVMIEIFLDGQASNTKTTTTDVAFVTIVA
ncbi:MAG: hypothetical protein OES09_14415 [Gammaproteobacteria bacterium]|nr:hypothetical protein [Gammaproteobacteria bacterium]